MRLMLFVIIILIMNSCKQVYHNPLTNIKNNRVCDSAQMPLTGRVEYYYSNNIKSGVYNYQNGIRIGEWALFDHAGNEIQSGICKLNSVIKDSLSNHVDVDFVLQDDWKEGGKNFLSIYVFMNNSKGVNESEIKRNILSNHSGNVEVIFLHNTDTLAEFRDWK